MKLRDVGLCLLGGSILYVSMAACSGRPAGTSSTRGTTSGGGAGGAVVHNGGAGGIGDVIDSGIDAITDPVPPARAEAGSRLKPRWRQGEDGAKEYIAGLWWDSQRQEDCSFILAADGKLRCLPPGSDFRYFADATCDTPMVLAQGTCTPPKYGISTTEAACGVDVPSTHVWSIGGETNPPMIYGKSGSSCFAIGPTTPDWKYYTVGAEVPASSFVAGTLGHD